MMNHLRLFFTTLLWKTHAKTSNSDAFVSLILVRISLQVHVKSLTLAQPY